MEGLHEGLDYPVVPSLWEMFQLVQVVPNPFNFVRGIWPIAEFRPELGIQNVLVYYRCRGNAQSTAETSEKD